MLYSKTVLPVLIAGALLTPAANAAIYKCTIKGVLTFTQFPCGEDAEEINIKITQPQSTPQMPSRSSAPEEDNSIENYIAIKKIERQIDSHQLEIKEIKKKLAERLKVINYMTQDKANRLGASSIQDAINTQSASIKTSSENAIKAEQQQIEVLEKRKLALLSTVP